MKKILQVILMAAALGAGTAAHATTYDFSYTFADGGIASGSFDGTANGNLVTGLSNLQVYFNGRSFDSYSPPKPYGFVGAELKADSAVASFDGLQNNIAFLFYSSVPGQFFTYENATYHTSVDAYNWETGDNSRDDFIDPAVAASRWTLKAVSAVPEPTTYAMLLAGLGIVGFSARRNKRS